MKTELLYNSNLGLLLVRLGLAAVFINSGVIKFMTIAGTTAFFARLGVPAPFVYIVATVELLGGLAMLFGVGTRIFGWLLAIDMFFAIYLVKFALGFANAGYRLETMLLLAALGIAFAGVGRYALCGGKCDITKKTAS